ncbi:MAG TPA: hypothetical protein VFV87_15940 [Pirellulaceae bacterium]|nr:hypothetical protein [Pirellulaceae bacterium]
MTDLITPEDFGAVNSSLRAIVFLWVNWSFQARHSKRTFDELLARWEHEMADVPIAAFAIDVSVQEGKTWEATRTWLQSQQQPVDELTFSGCGGLLWLRSGQVVAHSMSASGYEQDELFAFTKSVFELDDIPVINSSKLSELASKYQPPQWWYEGDEENLFD